MMRAGVLASFGRFFCEFKCVGEVTPLPQQVASLGATGWDNHNPYFCGNSIEDARLVFGEVHLKLVVFDDLLHRVFLGLVLGHKFTHPNLFETIVVADEAKDTAFEDNLDGDRLVIICPNASLRTFSGVAHADEIVVELRVGPWAKKAEWALGHTGSRKQNYHQTKQKTH